MKIYATIFAILALAALTGGILGATHQYGIAITMGIFSALMFQGASQNRNNVRRRE